MIILLADDHPLFTDAITRQLAAAYPGVTLHTAEDLTTVTALIADIENIDLAVLDWDMPGMQGLDSIAELRADHPDLKIVILSGRIDDATVHEVLALGIRGFIPKSSSGNAVIAALSVVLSGCTYLPVETALAHNRKRLPKPPNARAPGKDLTERETDILKLLAQGFSNKEIARQLGVQEITIKMHASRIFAKLRVRNRVQAVSHALKTGLLEDRSTR